MVSTQGNQTQPSRAVPPDSASGSHNVHPDAGWGYASHHLSRWPALVAIVTAVVLYMVLPSRLVVPLSKHVLLVLSVMLMIPIVLTTARDRHIHRPWKRPVFMVLIALISITNFASLGLLIHNLAHVNSAEARTLLLSAAYIWLTNVVVFGLWYWELDRGGPVARLSSSHPEPDFLFPQMVTPECAPGTWTPAFLDYLYVSFTNATAFSPTDTMPLTDWAKLLMMAQSVASLLIIGLVAARAVNILA